MKKTRSLGIGSIRLIIKHACATFFFSHLEDIPQLFYDCPFIVRQLILPQAKLTPLRDKVDHFPMFQCIIQQPKGRVPSSCNVPGHQSDTHVEVTQDFLPYRQAFGR